MSKVSDMNKEKKQALKYQSECDLVPRVSRNMT